MELIRSLDEVRRFSHQARGQGRSLGLVPTMGALHEGHLSLVRKARSEYDSVVVSIFVNPTQFGPREDLGRYPRDLQRDLGLLTPFKIDAVFAPDARAMYPSGFDTFVDPGAAAQPLEGALRPGHFRGVATVVLKLLNLVQPSTAYFGQKDFQQAMVIRRLIEDFNLEVRLVLCPIVRQPDGLAMSSRNAYLSTDERVAALALFRALRRGEAAFCCGETRTEAIVDEMKRAIAAEPRLQLDYAVVAEAQTLAPAAVATAGSVALVAARVGSTRLLDNLILAPPGTNDADRLRQVEIRNS
ncbi:MAG TPA: pantoate--beta-alanine ligase [Terriglobia bacterium]|nr:pantoate--beta-alanine ligase [Terriglobia bacterium]